MESAVLRVGLCSAHLSHDALHTQGGWNPTFFPSPEAPGRAISHCMLACGPPRPLDFFPTWPFSPFLSPWAVTCRTSCCQAIDKGCPLPTPLLPMPGCWARSSCRATWRRSCSNARVSRSKRASCSFTEARMLAAECTLQSSMTRMLADCRQSRASQGGARAGDWRGRRGPPAHPTHRSIQLGPQSSLPCASVFLQGLILLPQSNQGLPPHPPLPAPPPFHPSTGLAWEEGAARGARGQASVCPHASLSSRGSRAGSGRAGAE